MSLSSYHQNYTKRSDEDLAHRAEIKEKELQTVFTELNFSSSESKPRIGILGCADARHVSAHKQIFEKLLGKEIDMTTFDVEIEHLKGESNIVQHDLTLPLPNSPYDILFGHVVLKFIETEKQWNVLQNAYTALQENGIAIFVFDEEDKTTKDALQADGHFSVPLERWEKQLTENGMLFQELHWNFENEKANMIRGLKGGALVLIKK